MQATLLAAGHCGHTGYQTTRWASTTTAAAYGRLADLAVPDADGGILANPHRTYTWAEQVSREPDILRIVGELLGAPPAVHSSLLLVKRSTPFTVPPHQDGVDGESSSTVPPIDPYRSVAVWFAFDDATGPGCLDIVPGSQADGYRPHEYRTPADPVYRGTPLALDPTGLQFTPVPVPAGLAVVMDMRTIHRSGTPTRGRRAALNVRYMVSA